MMRGFSVLEILVVLAITGILLAIAVPSYRQYVARSHRADAIRSILSVAACLERSRGGSGYYDTTTCADVASSEYYRLRIEPAGQAEALVYRITAVPLPSGLPDPCGSLSLDQAGTRRTGDFDGDPARCWAGR